MKRKLIYRAAGLFLASALVVTSMCKEVSAESIQPEEPVFQEEVGEEMKNTLSGNNVPEVPPGQEYPLLSTINLFELNWKNESDDTINHYLGMSEWDRIGAWLSSMTESDFEDLLKRDTVLIQETSVMESDSTEPVRKLYYEYALDAYNKSMYQMRATPLKTSGYWTTKIVKLDANGNVEKTATITNKISGIDTTVSTSQQQKVTVAKSITGNWCNVVWSDDAQELKTYKEGKEDTTYPLVRAYFHYDKPAGYTVSTEYSINNSFRYLYWSPTDTFGTATGFFVSGTDGALASDIERKSYPVNTTYNGKSTANLLASESNKTHYLVSIVNMYMNAGVGTTANAASGNLVQTITLSPSRFNVNYNGNGATSGSVAAQSCVYDTNYTAQQNGYSRAYTVTYNGNGGAPAVASQTANYIFRGWGLNQAGTVNYAPGANYKNLTAVNGGTVNMYAVWSPAAITLPTASRTGYRFAGWNIGAAGASYVPASNVTAVANWTANTYRIAFNSNGGSACSTITAAYDAGTTLPTPVRAGYTFNGWVGEGGTFKGTAKNLTATNGATVTLTAVWDANTDTPYKINRFYQKEENSETYLPFSKAFPLPATETLYGTTDTTVTVPAGDVKGYYTPDAQMVKISGNGNTVVNFYYKVIPQPKIYTYQVKHYIKTSPTGEYSLFATDSRSIKEDSVVTPELSAEAIAKVNAVKNCECKSPSTQTVTINKEGMVIEYYYDCVNKKVDYKVEHYVRNGVNGAYTLFKSEILTANAGATITPPLNEDAIAKVNEVKDCQCKEPALQTVSVENGTIIKYYYDCVQKEQPISNSGITENQIDELTKRIATGLSFSLNVNGTDYEIAQKEDGTLGIKFSNPTDSKITIPDVVTVGEKVYRITEIYEGAFKDNTTLKEVELSANISKIGDSAFQGCTNLNTVTVHEGISTIGSKAFYGCTSLTKFQAPSTLKTIGTSAFQGCIKLKTVTLNKGLVQIGKKAFYKCNAMTKITIPSTVIKIGSYAFAKCTKLKTLKFSADSQLLSIGEGGFSECSALTKVTLPDKLTKITKKTFYKCKNLKTIKIGTAATHVGDSAFRYCSKLTTVSGGDKVTTIYAHAFRDCTSLKKITLKSQVQKIYQYAFYNCKTLKTVTIKSKAIVSVGSKAFKKCHKKITFKVPSSKKSAYMKLFKGKY